MINYKTSQTIFQNSMFASCTFNNNFAHLHIPMQYFSRNILTLETCAQSIITHIKHIKNGKPFYYEIIDDLVLKFLKSDVLNLPNETMNVFFNLEFFQKTQKNLIGIYDTLPDQLRVMEDNIKHQNTIEFDNFKQIYEDIIFLSSLNNFNAHIEVFLSEFLKEQKNNQKALKYIEKGLFSHIKYLLDEKAIAAKTATKEQTRKFIWNAAFLEDKYSDGCIYDNYANEELEKGTIRNKTEIIPEVFEYPNIPTTETEKIPDLPLILLWAKLLQTNTEYRHYWQFRFMRNIRFFYDCDPKVINKWTFKDYEENLTKIK